MQTFKPNLLLAAMIAGGLTVTSAQVFADEQEAAAEDVEVIQVTGIRSSLKRSQALKMDNDSIVEAISAEDIGKLPDVSIADSLSRLTGIATQRINGRSQTVSVRGLSPDFTTATLNGRQQVSTSDNRAVEFDMYPSELLTGVVVYKTPDASVTAQAIGGTIDMQTISPLRHGEQAFVVGGRYEWNQDDALVNEIGDDGERYTASYIDQFMDNTVGVAFGYAHLQNSVQNQHYEAWGFADKTLEDGPNAGESVRILGGSKGYLKATELDRDSYMGVLEYQPNESFTAKFDVFYSDFTESTYSRGLETPFEWSGHKTLTDYEVDNGLVTSATFEDVRAVIRQDATIREADTLAVGLNIDYQLNEYWSLNGDISYSKADRVDDILETFQGHQDEQTFDLTSTDKGFMLHTDTDFSDASKIVSIGPQGWGKDQVGLNGQDNSQSGFFKSPQSEDELTSIKLVLTRELDNDYLRSVEFGVNYDDRSKYKSTGDELFLYHEACNGLDYTDPDCGVALPSDLATHDATISHRGLGAMTGFNPFDLYSNGFYDTTPDQSPNVASKTWWVDETITTGFVKLNIDADVMDIPVRGNAGVQVVYTDQSSNSFAAANNDAGELEVSPVEGGTDYTEVLPSLNLTATVADNQFVRLGMARVMARPRMDEMKAAFTYSWNEQGSPSNPNGEWSGGGGNPELNPWIANQIDVAYDYYFSGDLGYFSVAYFYKDLDSYVTNESIDYDFTDLPRWGENQDVTEGRISVPQNGEGGSIDGFEVSLNVVGEMFHDSLAGWGATASASFTDSAITPNEGNPDEPLPGLSEDVFNFSVYYENDGFSTRVSGRYRSEFLGDVASYNADRVYRYIDEELLVDAQVGYSFEGGQFDGLSLVVQAMNLTNQEFKSFNQHDPREIIDYQEYGRSFSAGFIYKF